MSKTIVQQVMEAQSGGRGVGSRGRGGFED